MPQKRMRTVNRSSYLLEQLIPAVEHQLAGVPGVETLLRKLRNETWRHGRKEAAIFHAQRALDYHRAGKLVAIEQYERIGERRVFFDLTIREPEPTGGMCEIAVELKNWKGWYQWNALTRNQRLINLERQIQTYTDGNKFVRLEFRGFIPDTVKRSRILSRLVALNKLELDVVP